MIQQKGVSITTKNALRFLYQDFGENTSMHGVARTLIREQWRRIAWSIMVLSCVVLAVAQFVYVLLDFYSYPVVSVVRRRRDSNLAFPAVTICNLNKIKKSSFAYRNLLAQNKNVTSTLQSTYTSPLFKAQSVQWSDIYGHDLYDMMVDCTFNQEPCSVGNFTYLKATSSGKCYTFNLETDNPLYTSTAGSTNGLVLEMDIEAHEYMSMTTTTGIKVVVHNPAEPPFPEDGGFLASPGFATSIGIKKRKMHRLPSPYGMCVKEFDHNEYSLHSKWRYKYTDNECKKLCQQHAIYRICGCCDTDLPCERTAILQKSGNERKEVYFCNNTRDVSCIQSLGRELKTIRLECGKACPPTCDQITYKTDVSTGYWPSDSYLDLFLAKVTRTKLKNTTRENLMTVVHKNFLRLEVYYNSLVVEEVVMKPLYNWSKFLGDIGGQMGLWLGFSVLTGMEIVELFLDILAILSSWVLQKVGAVRYADKVTEKSGDTASASTIEKSDITRDAENDLEKSVVITSQVGSIE